MGKIRRETTCCFTGHRLEKLPWREREDDEACARLKDKIYDAAFAAYSSGMRHFICGMATGCDMYFCEAVMRLREEKPGVTLEAAIPWEGQAERWAESLRKRYYRLVSECDLETLVQREYSHDCMMRRNRYMVDNSTLIIASYNGSPGGTMNTMLYAMRQGIEIIEISI